MTQPGHRGAKPGGEHSDAPAQASSVDPAVSMSLLTALLVSPLDAGYGYYQVDHGLWSTGLISHIAVFAMAVALGFGSIIAIGSLRCPANDVKADLRKQTATRSSNAEALSDELQSLNYAIDDLSQSGPPIPMDGARDLVTMTRPVSGLGITVTLMDRSGPGKGSGAVRDQDVAMVVNVPWAAGAGAISVNGQHIGPGTFVHTVGVVILVNVTPVSSPYEVTAIGDSNMLSVVLVRDATGDYLFTAQLVSGMIVSSKISQLLSTEVLASSSSQYV